MPKILDSLFGRKSVRAFTGQKIPEGDVGTILEAAVQAPTAGNQQLYTILRITDPEKKHRLSISCDHQAFIEQADLVLVFCADCLKWYNAFREAGCAPRLPGEGDFLLAVCDALIAAQNAVVAAEELGIGSCYIGDIMENYEIQREILSLPEYVFPAAMLVMGYPTEQQKERKKPERVDLHWTVQENAYHVHGPDELRAMFEARAGEKGYDSWMRAFCERKYHSGFSREMTRSVRAFLRTLGTEKAGRMPMEAMEAILSRRSTRSMKPDMPPRALIEQVLEAGRSAPSGGNNQSTHMLVITSRKVLDELAALAEHAFSQMEAGPDTYASLRNSIEASKRGGYVFHYGAPVLIVTANRKGYGNAMADSACALENMMIAANALNLGSCWINQLHWLDGNPEVRTYLAGLGLGENETVTGGLILGYGEHGAPVREPLERKGNPVDWIG